jgi:hypothetical protein
MHTYPIVFGSHSGAMSAVQDEVLTAPRGFDASMQEIFGSEIRACE